MNPNYISILATFCINNKLPDPDYKYEIFKEFIKCKLNVNNVLCTTSYAPSINKAKYLAAKHIVQKYYINETVVDISKDDTRDNDLFTDDLFTDETRYDDSFTDETRDDDSFTDDSFTDDSFTDDSFTDDSFTDETKDYTKTHTIIENTNTRPDTPAYKTLVFIDIDTTHKNKYKLHVLLKDYIIQYTRNTNSAYINVLKSDFDVRGFKNVNIIFLLGTLYGGNYFKRYNINKIIIYSKDIIYNQVISIWDKENTGIKLIVL